MSRKGSTIQLRKVAKRKGEVSAGATQPDIERIEAQDLRDNARLRKLYLQAVRRRYWPNSSAAALEFAAYAEKALADDKHGTPGKLFYALVKRKDGSMVTEAQETRAQQRFPSHVREDLVVEAIPLAKEAAEGPPKLVAIDGGQEAVFAADVGYAHACLMQCFLPQKPIQERDYELNHGRASLVVEAGRLINPERRNQWTRCQVPSGPKPRLILPYIIGEAVRNGTPEVDLGRSLRQFMDRLGIPVSGRNGKNLTREVQNIAAASILIGQWNHDGAHMVGSRVARSVSFWIERDPDQLTLWTPTMTLSDDFFEAVQQHRVPVNMEHLAKLSRSPRRMDLYSWLSYRTPKLSSRGRMPVKLHALWEIFAPDISRFRDFRARLLRDLRAIAGVYPDFKAEIDGDILWLRRSKPPVPYQPRRPSASP